MNRRKLPEEAEMTDGDQRRIVAKIYPLPTLRSQQGSPLASRDGSGSNFHFSGPPAVVQNEGKVYSATAPLMVIGVIRNDRRSLLASRDTGIKRPGDCEVC